MKYKGLLFVASAFTYFFLMGAGLIFAAPNPVWERSTFVTDGEGEPFVPNNSEFNCISSDSSGNIYAVGYISSDHEYDFGNGVTVSGAVYFVHNAVIVKYNSSGVAQWARSTVAASTSSNFYGVSVDSSGNIYAVGTIYGDSEFDFGNGATVSGAYNSGFNAVIVKYNPSGVTQWARSTTVAPGYSNFYSASVNSSGDVYTAGRIMGGGEYGFGNGITVSGGFANAVIVKYNSSGDAQWADSAVVAPSSSNFYDIFIDSSDNIYTVGDIGGDEEFDFGNSVTVRGATNNNFSTLIVKYNLSGVAQWARSVVTTADPSRGFSRFDGIAVDSSGNSYAVGYINGDGEFDFGNGIAISGAKADEGKAGPGHNAVIVKYDSSGDAQWASSTVVAPSISRFNDIYARSSDSIYAVGRINGDGEYDFGNGVTVSGAKADEGEALGGSYNAVIVQYNSSGDAQWASSTSLAPNASGFNGVSTDSSGNIYTVGFINGDGEYDFGRGGTVSGAYDSYNNVITVKYAEDSENGSTDPEESTDPGEKSSESDDSSIILPRTGSRSK